jgi:FMN phosphatase YigB (HAD superfamily)
MEFEDRCHKVQEPKFDCLLFDLDDTLYPLSSGIAGHVKKNIEGKPSPAVTDYCLFLFSEFSVN